MEEAEKEDLKKKETMKISIREGAASSVMSGVTDSYITPFALLLKANNAHIGLLSSLPSLLSPFAQILGSRMMEKYQRKKILAHFIVLQALMWLPIMFLSLFFWRNVFTYYLPVILIVFYSLYAFFGSLGGPAWFSLLGDIVPAKIRGKYFGRRNKICGGVALFASIIAAFLLDFFKTKGLVLLGFSALFLIASIARMISASLFTKHYEPRLKFEKGYYFSFVQFLKKAPGNNFGKFVIFVSLINLSTNVAGPFFAVYMLKDLGFSYTTFMLMNISAAVFSLLSMPIWGKFSDKYGNKELIKIGCLFIPVFPFLWFLSGSPWYIAFVPQLFSGIGWAAFNMGVSNFIYDSVTPQRRGICVAYHNVVSGVGVFIGATFGGLLAQYLNVGFMNQLLFIFVLSGILRFAVVFAMLRLIKEVRSARKPKKNVFSYLKEINPVKGMIYEAVESVKGIENGFERVLNGKKGLI